MTTDKVQNPALPPILRDLPDQLIGERIILRPPHPGDGAAIWEAVTESRDRLRPWLPWADSHTTLSDSEAFARRAFARWQLREDLSLTIWEPGTGRCLGGSGLHRINWEVPAFEIGYWIRTSAEGQGYVIEAVRLLCTFAFETLGANRIEIRCDANNARSAAVPRRAGFLHEATLRNDSRTQSGELRDTLIFGMTPAEYKTVKQKGVKHI